MTKWLQKELYVNSGGVKLFDSSLLAMTEKERYAHAREQYKRKFIVCGKPPLKQYSTPAAVYDLLYTKQQNGASHAAIITEIKHHCEADGLSYSRQSSYRTLKNLISKGYVYKEDGLYRICGIASEASIVGDLDADGAIVKFCKILGHTLLPPSNKVYPSFNVSNNPSHWSISHYPYLADVDNKVVALVGPTLGELLACCFSEIREMHTTEFDGAVDDLVVYKECHKVNIKFRHVVKTMKGKKLLFEDSNGHLIFPYLKFPWLYYATDDVKNAASA